MGTIDKAHEDSGRRGAFFIASSAQANIHDFRKLTCDDIAKVAVKTTGR
jgi:hypothetical protein